MTTLLQMDYVEFYSPDLEATQGFMARAFGWDFVDYGPDYRDIQGAGIGGGVERAAASAPLIILKTDDLQAAYDHITAAGAKITREIFDFPGGRRFQFREPGGTEMAVWTPA
ncbi:MAG: VOC family protein [Paracoccus sp. (in: a-proteobacteria)]|uniref:VOC family protein n=1 Tax=Paracoccus sp. TaxID=267 RepID=UPI0026DF968A|nr:VOC family protein [Paracoccus sp. (in: a-proteobacteria)]MDO5613168.1 VOC family protein [Paracoccus sp. (in: a-proteobacteria)]